MPTWLWIVIVVLAVVVAVSVVTSVRARSHSDAGGPVPGSASPSAPEVATADVPPFDDAAGETVEAVSEDAELREDEGYRESLEPTPEPGPSPVPEPSSVPEPVPDGVYGPGSAAPTPDGRAPVGYPVKANADSLLFSTEESRGFRRSTADVYFRDAAAAEAAGFKRWDDHRS